MKVMPNCGVTVGLSTDSVSKFLHTAINTTGILFLFENQDPDIRAFQNEDSFKPLITSYKVLFINGLNIHYYCNCRLKTSLLILLILDLCLNIVMYICVDPGQHLYCS